VLLTAFCALCVCVSELLVLVGVLGSGVCPQLLRLDLLHVCCSPSLAPSHYQDIVDSAAQRPPVSHTQQHKQLSCPAAL
jgi:hypothetical protein